MHWILLCFLFCFSRKKEKKIKDTDLHSRVVKKKKKTLRTKEEKEIRGKTTTSKITTHVYDAQTSTITEVHNK